MIFQKVLFLIINSFSGKFTLSALSWERLKQQHADLYPVRRAREAEVRKIKTNNIKFAISVVMIMTACGLGICFVPEGIINSYFGVLCFLKFPDDSAQSVITDILASSATIIGLSFVVIGFSFEVVKEKASKTLETIFRSTRLYYVFSISIVSIIALVIMTALKHSVSTYIVGNFAILSCYLLLFTTISIAYMFGKVITYFDKEKINKLTRDYLFRLAQFQLLHLEYVAASEAVYAEEMAGLGIVPYNRFLGPDTETVKLKISSNKSTALDDVCLPLLSFLLTRINKRTTEPRSRFYPLRYQTQIREDAALFYFKEGTVMNKFDHILLKSCVSRKPINELSEEYQKEKDKLQEQVISAAEKGDKKEVAEGLESIRQLYSIYLNPQ